MNKKLFLIPLIFLFLFLLIYQTNASCVVQGYIKNIGGSLTYASTPAYCEIANQWSNSTGTSYFASFGGPADSCQSYCDNVFINASNSTMGRYGFPNGYFPLNSTNTAGWSSGSAHNINITLNLPGSPIIFIVSPSLNYYYNTNTNMWFNVTTDITSSWCGYSLDGAVNQTMGGSGTSWNYKRTLAITPDGLHSVLFYCNNTLGDWGISSNRTFYVDITPPVANLVLPVDGQTYIHGSSVTFTANCTDNVGLNSGGQLLIYGNWSGWGIKATQLNPSNNTNYPFPISGIGDGTYKWTAWCLDSAQNSAYALTNRTFTINSTVNLPPVVYTNNPLNGSTQTSNTVTFNLMCTDNIGVDYLELWLNFNGTWAINQTKVSPGNVTWWNKDIYLPDGNYTWAAWCNDTGSLTNMSENISFTVHYVAPPPGGGGGGGGNICSDTCYSGTTCPSSSTSVFGSCPTNQVCCTKSYCPYAKTFIDQYSMFSFSVYDLQTFCTVNTLNQTKLNGTIVTYTTSCGPYCFLFSIPFIGKYLEQAGIFLHNNLDLFTACIWMIILISLILIVTIWLVIRHQRKKKRRRY